MSSSSSTSSTLATGRSVNPVSGRQSARGSAPSDDGAAVELRGGAVVRRTTSDGSTARSTAGRAGPVDALQEGGDRLAPHLRAGLVDRGEPDVVHGGEAGVVVAHEGDVLGHPQALAAEAVQRPGGAEVVGGEDGRRQVVAADEAGDGAHARQLGEVAADDAHVAVEAVAGHRGAVPGAAGCAARAATAVDVDDALVAQAGEVVDREAGARLLVVVDGVDDR